MSELHPPHFSFFQALALEAVTLDELRDRYPGKLLLIFANASLHMNCIQAPQRLREKGEQRVSSEMLVNLRQFRLVVRGY